MQFEKICRDPENNVTRSNEEVKVYEFGWYLKVAYSVSGFGVKLQPDLMRFGVQYSRSRS